MKNKNIRKHQSKHHHEHEFESKPQKEKVNSSEFEIEDKVFTVEYDRYSAIVKQRDNVVGVFKAADRKWKIRNIPFIVQKEVEALY